LLHPFFFLAPLFRVPLRRFPPVILGIAWQSAIALVAVAVAAASNCLVCLKSCKAFSFGSDIFENKKKLKSHFSIC
jgi:hypothetical protein